MNNQKIVIDYLDKNNELSKELIWGEMYRTDQYFIRSIPFLHLTLHLMILFRLK